MARGRIPWLLLDAFMPTFQFAAVITAAELGFFDVLRHKPLTLTELAERTNSSQTGMEVLVQVLAALGYVEEEAGDRVRLTPIAQTTVPLEQMRTMAPFFREQLRIVLDAPRAVRDAPAGGLVNPERIQDGEVGRGFQAAMRWLASANVADVAESVELPGTARRLLDVGGSHGLYTVALCRKYPQLHGTVFDWPIGIEAARETVQQHPDVASRIDFVEGDFERDEQLPSGYDVCFLGNIVHGLSPSDNQRLFQKLALASNGGSTVVILDQLAEPTGSAFARSVAALIGFNLFLVAGGRAYRFEQLRQWLADAGFSDATRTPLRRTPGLSLVTAHK
jgi:hypothetical protein